MAKAEEFNGKSEGELQSDILSMKRELLNLRFQQATGELENTARFRQVRRNIARAKTALRAKKLKEKKLA